MLAIIIKYDINSQFTKNAVQIYKRRITLYLIPFDSVMVEALINKLAIAWLAPEPAISIH